VAVIEIMETTLSWSPGLKLSDYEGFAIRNALKYAKGDLRQVSNILEISSEELRMKMSNLEIQNQQTLGEIDYWRQHKRISERFLNGVISKEEFDQEIAELSRPNSMSISTDESFILPDQTSADENRARMMTREFRMISLQQQNQ
jgi:hypothetical protein